MTNLNEQLLAGNFKRTGPEATSLSDPVVDTPMVVTLDQVKPYDFNPRVVRNPRYDDIKASILERGLDEPPPITRRPDESHYIIRNGGNTRLEILNELWIETKEERFFKFLCIFRPWQSELVALTGHLAENELRGELTFIEKALGIKKASELMDTNSQKQLSQMLTKHGYPISQQSISRMMDVVAFLLPIIPNLLYSGLSHRAIIHLLKLRKSALNYWVTHATGKTEQDNFIALYSEVLAQFDTTPDEFNPVRITDELVGRMAEALGHNYDVIMLDIEQYGSKEKMLSLPPTPEKQFTVEELFGKPPTPIVLSEDIFTPQEKKTDSTPVHSTTCHSEDEASVDPYPEPIHSLQSIDRVKQIQDLVTEHMPVDEIESFSVPVPSTNGLFPVNDIWTIAPMIDAPERLRIHIGQLAMEIADEYKLADGIQTIDEGNGFTVLSTEHDIFILLQALINTPLLVGSDIKYPALLSDQGVIKLYRLIRLLRRLHEIS